MHHRSISAATLAVVVVLALNSVAFGATRTLANDEEGVPPASGAEQSRARRVQVVVDDLRSRLAIPQAVVVSLAAENKLMVSVERLPGSDGRFALSFENTFLDALNNDELDAVVAHELGHVWIFTHHPFLQTEELANDVALRVVTRQDLERVYEKVWQRVGAKGDLVYLPAK